MACGMISLQFVAWIGSDFGPKSLASTQWPAHESLYDRPGSIPMRAVSIARLR